MSHTINYFQFVQFLKVPRLHLLKISQLMLLGTYILNKITKFLFHFIINYIHNFNYFIQILIYFFQVFRSQDKL